MVFLGMLRYSALVLGITMLLSCSHSKGESSGGVSGEVSDEGNGNGEVVGTTQLSGTVAAEQDIGSTSIGFRDSAGKIVFVPTGLDGTFSTDLTSLGLTLPVIARVPNPATGRFMFSYASAEGTSNIHPLTDPILRIWFSAKGLSGTIDSAFTSTTPLTLPTAGEIGFIKSIMRTIVSDLLGAAGVSPDSFDLITSPFTANGSGFDTILKGTRINATDTGAVNIMVVPFTALDTAVTGSGFASTAFLDSSIISLAADTTPPAPPNGLAAASLCGNKALLIWPASPSNDVTSYRVYEETRGHIATVTYTAFIAANLSSNITYTFSTRAVDAAGNVSASSNASSATIEPCALPPIPPSALSGPPTLTALSSSQLRLDWTDSQSNLLEYRVYRAGTPNVLLARTAGTIGKTFTDFQLVPQTQYCYTVTLVSLSSLESDPSPTVCGFTLSGAPPAPTNVTATVSGAGQVAVSWGAVGNATTYRLYQATQAGLTKANYAALSGGTLTSGITKTSTNVTSLAAGTTYHFMVTAVNGSGEESVESIEVSATP